MKTYISFYLSQYKIHIFKKSISEIGNPKYIRFLVKENEPSIIMEAYNKKDFHSHRVKPNTKDSRGMEVSSYLLCKIIKNRMGWVDGKSYRVQGNVYPSQQIVVYDLKSAVEISSSPESRQVNV